MIKSIKIEMDNGNSISLSEADESGIGPDLLKLAVGVLKKEIDAAKPAPGNIETK